MPSILIIEDQEEQAGMLRSLIEYVDPSIIVDVVPDLYTARLMIMQGDYDAVSVDLNLPDCRGVKTYEAVRKLTRANLVVFSGADTVTEVRKMLKNGDAIVKKPDSPKAVDELVQQVVAGAHLGAAG